MENKITALIDGKKYNEALKIIEENNERLFKNNPFKTIDDHIYILIELGLFDECFKVIQHYKNYPYQSIKVEEFISEFEEKLLWMINNAKNQKNKERNTDNNGVDFSKFGSKKEEDVFVFIHQIYMSRKLKDYEEEVRITLQRNVSDQINFMCLCILFELKSNQLVDFQYKNSRYLVNLSDIHFPYSCDDKEYFKILDNLSKSINDVSIFNLAKDLLSYLRLEIFPKYFEKSDIEFIEIAIINVAKKMYGQPIVLLENERVRFFMNLLEKISNS